MTTPLFEMTPVELLSGAGPLPDFHYAKGTDVETEIALIWSVVRLLGPRKVVELGTRHGISTRAIVDAIDRCPPKEGGTIFVTIDPEDCRPHLDGVDVVFLQATGESAFEKSAFEKLPDRRALGLFDVDILMIDTDPHTYDQTNLWLDTWVEHRLCAGGVAMFHDIVGARTEIQVGDAVRDWVKNRNGWVWREYVADAAPTYGPYGLGLLWRTK